MLGFVIPVLCSLLGLLFGALAHRKLRHLPNEPGGGRAIAAMALGGAQIALVAVVILL